jgi:hypothetical protein
MSTTADLKKATDACDKAEKSLDEWTAKRNAVATALELSQREADTLREQHRRFILGRGDALPAGVLVAADAAVKQLVNDCALLDAAVAEAETKLVDAETAADDCLRAAWFEVETAARSKLVTALVSTGWRAWRARQCAGETGVSFFEYIERAAQEARVVMYPTTMLDVAPECPALPLPTKYALTPKIGLERREVIRKAA